MFQDQKFKCKILWGCLLFFLIWVPAVALAGNTDTEQQKKVPEKNRAQLLQAIKKAAAEEANIVEELKKRLGRLDILKKAVLIEINAYNIQNSAHSNLLLQSATTITDLQKAFDENQLSLNTLDDKIKDFSKRRDGVQEFQRQTQDQISLNERQSIEIKDTTWSKAEKTPLLSALDTLNQTLAEKQSVIQNLLDALEPLLKQLETVKALTSQLNEALDQQITSRKAQELFTRKYMLLRLFKKEAITKELSILATNLLRPLHIDFLRVEGRRIRETAVMSLLMLLFLALVAAALISRLRGHCRSYLKRPFVPTRRWRFLCVSLIRRSLLLFGIFFALYSYNIIQFSHYRLPFHRPVFNILLILLFSRWLLVFLKFRQPDGNLFIPQVLAAKIYRTTVLLRYVVIAYVIIQWAVGEDSFVLFGGRLFIELYLMACCVTFWQAFRKLTQPFASEPSPLKILPYSPLMVLTYLITLGALIIEVSGYPAMAAYWLLSWARTLAVLFWAAILFKVIGEWRNDYQPSEGASEEPLPSVYPVRRLFVSVSWLLWFYGVIVTLTLAWSTRQKVFSGIYAALNKSFVIGNIQLSLLGVLFAILILFLTLIITRFARYILPEKIFSESDLEPGLQDSITTITIYVMWSLGVVLALSVLGVSTTSLTVVFGALGVGLGFGLQAIFNNFVSGIILLFERPIQVGDAVEINGVWGTVKKINVRATVVQTFDNASLIIPNSEFISSQVTNWSFKEPSLRRKVSVGVAYGSDVELVRQTLLEIASQTKNVFKKPKPDVIFDDHGDSALIFILRYWTTVDYYYTTSTDIRFAIDRLFRERNIEIAFPQQDIHIRSIVNHKKPVEDNNL